jgi:hypothetical protein
MHHANGLKALPTVAGISCGGCGGGGCAVCSGGSGAASPGASDGGDDAAMMAMLDSTWSPSRERMGSAAGTTALRPVREGSARVRSARAVCTHSGCTTNANARGLCAKHGGDADK